MVTSYAPLMMQYGLVCEPEAQYITTQMNNAQVAIQHNDYVMSKNVSDWALCLSTVYRPIPISQLLRSGTPSLAITMRMSLEVVTATISYAQRYMFLT